MHAKVLTALLGTSAGIVIGEFLTFGSEIAVCSFLLGVTQIVLSFFEKHQSPSLEKRFSIEKFSLPLFSGIFFVMLFVGVMRYQFIETKNSFVCQTSCSFIGVVSTSPSTKDAYQIFSVKVDDAPDTYDVRVRTLLYPKVTVGDRVSLFGKVKEPSPSMEHSGVRPFDYSQYLKLHDVGSEMLYPKMERSTDVRNEKYSLTATLSSLQEKFLSYIFLYVSEPSASLSSGVLFGNSSMSKEMIQTFRITGLSHVIVLSGFNIAILIGFTLLLLQVLPLVLRVIVAGIFVMLFVSMVGAEVSIVRATIMSCVALLALLLGRAYVAKQALLLSLLGIILYEPEHLIYDASLHLSFLATAGIVYMSEGMQLFFSKITMKTYREIMMTTVAAYLATLPYVLYTFGTVSVYALFTNILILPLVPFLMLLTGITVMGATLWSGLGIIFGYMTTLLGSLIISVARFFEKLPYASLEFSISFLEMFFLYVTIITIFLFLFSRKKNFSDETRETKNDEIISEIIHY